MDRRLQTVAADQGGVFTRAQACRYGYDDERIQRMVRSGRWHRIRRGAYTDRQAYEGLGALDRHRILMRAVHLSLGDRVAFSHTSAALAHGFDLWAVDLTRVHVTRLDGGAGRVERDLQHHVGELADGDVTRVDGLPTTAPTRTVLETSMIVPVEQGLVVADSALRMGAVSRERLRELLESSREWPGARDAGAVVSLADGRAESAGETRARLAMSDAGLPAPELQVDICDRFGTLVGRVDFLFPEQNTIVEFDGKVKYDGTYGEPSDVVYEEKLREDRLREMGYEFVRITWADLGNPARLAARIRHAFARAEARRTAAFTR
ncbi:MAG: type IV toxin-antitoxin system AbiEi family antitoxin domain-containing protein [Streptosporangiales bacterium]|nr:type IV toxin-antitoxin system AbiEi family antitoxin domain-containing protein [Streptosporangiales bacterium]